MASCVPEEHRKLQARRHDHLCSAGKHTILQVTVLEIIFLGGSKYLLPSVKVGSDSAQLTYLVAKFGGHIMVHLPSVQVVIKFKTKQNPKWSKACLVLHVQAVK